jgi:hypothetical protein
MWMCGMVFFRRVLCGLGMGFWENGKEDKFVSFKCMVFWLSCVLTMTALYMHIACETLRTLRQHLGGQWCTPWIGWSEDGLAATM